MTTVGFTKTEGYLDWMPEPSTPTLRLPEGTVDAHCHVFGPGKIFPYAPQRKYTPCDAGKEDLFRIRDRLGISRNVIVQATCHGSDNSAMLDAIAAADGRARGVASVNPDIGAAALRDLHDQGVRGVRFNFLKRLVDRAPDEQLMTIARKIEPLGWHLVLYFEAADLSDLQPLFRTLPTPLVIDHLGRPDVTAPLDGPEFTGLLRFVDSRNDIWVKVSCPERLSKSGPPARDGQQYAYTDVVPFARQMISDFGDRVLWGTDWPHPNLTDHMPDDGLLVDHIRHIAPTPADRQRLLVTNPMALYWPEEQDGS